MLECLRVRLETHGGAAGRSDSCDIQIGRDLFAQWTVTLRCARVGAAGRTRRFVAASEAEVCRVVRERLGRRRAGRGYTLREISMAESVDVRPWLGPICALLGDDGGRGTGGANAGLDATRPADAGRSMPPLRDDCGHPGGAGRGVVDLADERRRRALERMRRDVEVARDELLALYAAAAEPSETADKASLLIECCDRLLATLEELAGG